MKAANNYNDIRMDNGLIDLRKMKEKINNKEFKKKVFFKSGSSKKVQMSVHSVYNELIAEELAKDFGIECAHYELAGTKNGGCRCFSEDFIGDKFAITFYDLKYVLEFGNNHEYFDKLDNRCSLELINQMLELFSEKIDESEIDIEYREKFNKYKRKLSQDEINKIMYEINNIYIFDILIANTDNNPGNFGIMLDENGVISMPSFDNEMLLNNGAILTGSYAMLPDINISKNLKEYINEPNQVLIYYFSKPENEKYFEIFKDKLWIISEENIENIIKRVEERTKTKIDDEIKKEYREGFRKNIENLSTIIEYVENPFLDFK